MWMVKVRVHNCTLPIYVHDFQRLSSEEEFEAVTEFISYCNARNHDIISNWLGINWQNF